jgi:hypothetical protein
VGCGKRQGEEMWGTGGPFGVMKMTQRLYRV